MKNKYIAILTDVPQDKKCGANTRIWAIQAFLNSIRGLSCGIFVNDPPESCYDVLITCRARMHDASLYCDAKLRILDVDNETDFNFNLYDTQNYLMFINRVDLNNASSFYWHKTFLCEHPVNTIPTPRIKTIGTRPIIGVMVDRQINKGHPAVNFAEENDCEIDVKVKSSVIDDLEGFYQGIDYLWIDDHPAGGVSIKGIEARARGIPVLGGPFARYGYSEDLKGVDDDYKIASFNAANSVKNQTPFNCYRDLLDAILSV